MKNAKKRNCGYCGKGFVPKTANALYCTPKCKAGMKNLRKRTKREKVLSEQRVKLPKPPTSQNGGSKPTPYEVQRNTFVLIGIALTILIKAICKSCGNIDAVAKAIKRDKGSAKKK